MLLVCFMAGIIHTLIIKLEVGIGKCNLFQLRLNFLKSNYGKIARKYQDVMSKLVYLVFLILYALIFIIINMLFS